MQNNASEKCQPYVQAAAGSGDDGKGGGPGAPTGVVVANDASLQRANLLTHQTKRSNSPALIVTNHQVGRLNKSNPIFPPSETCCRD
jgi:hypothetical protein